LDDLQEREAALSADQDKNSGVAGISAAVEELVLDSSKPMEPAVSQEKKVSDSSVQTDLNTLFCHLHCSAG